MDKRIYINDFCEDLNYRGVILYIGNVDKDKLLKAFEKSYVNKRYRLDYALNKKDTSQRDFIYVENCDLQDLDYPIWEYFEEGYDVYVLHEENDKYYVKKKLG